MLFMRGGYNNKTRMRNKKTQQHRFDQGQEEAVRYDMEEALDAIACGRDGCIVGVNHKQVLAMA
jgi:hypothetical protein